MITTQRPRTGAARSTGAIAGAPGYRVRIIPSASSTNPPTPATSATAPGRLGEQEDRDQAGGDQREAEQGRGAAQAGGEPEPGGTWRGGRGHGAVKRGQGSSSRRAEGVGVAGALGERRAGARLRARGHRLGEQAAMRGDPAVAAVGQSRRAAGSAASGAPPGSAARTGRARDRRSAAGRRRRRRATTRAARAGEVREPAIALGALDRRDAQARRRDPGGAAGEGPGAEAAVAVVEDQHRGTAGAGARRWSGARPSVRRSVGRPRRSPRRPRPRRRRRRRRRGRPRTLRGSRGRGRRADLLGAGGVERQRRDPGSALTFSTSRDMGLSLIRVGLG